MKKVLWLVILVCLLGIIFVAYNSNDNYTLETKENSTDANIKYTPNFMADVYFTKEEDQSNQYSDDMIKYITKLLKKGTLDKGLKEISADYIILDDKSKKIAIKNDKHGILQSYLEAEGRKLDEWFQVDFSEYGKDIVIKQIGEEKDIVYYFPRWNKEGIYDQALHSKGNGELYFINWNGINYMAISTINKDKHIIGVTIYNYSGPLIGVLMRQELDDKLNVKVSYYSYCTSGTGQQPEGSTYWPE